MRRLAKVSSVSIGVGAAMAVADVSIVTLALPQLLAELHTTVEGVAAVLAVYTIVLALGLVLVGAVAGRLGRGELTAAGFSLFAAGAIVCASASSLSLLLIGRAIQGLGGAGALFGCFELLDGAGRGRRAWLNIAILAAAAGPALGGALTEAFSWRAIFIVQAPVGALAAVASLKSGRSADVKDASPAPPGQASARSRWAARVALLVLSAALSAVLFLLVLLLVAGWGESPLKAAIAVSVLPIMAAIGSRIRTDPHMRAVLGCLLVGGGLSALAWLPQAKLAWTIVPQVLAGLGLGMALPALTGELLPERTARQAAGLLALRHVGIAVVLAGLAPLIASQLDSATRHAKLQGVAIVLGAKLAPREKLELAPELLSSINESEPRKSLRTALASHRSRFQGSDAIAYAGLSRSADATLLEAIASAFRDAFLIAAGLALLAAATLALQRRPASIALLGLILAVLAPLVYAYEHAQLAPKAVALTDACGSPQLPSASGLEGAIQSVAIKALDQSACHLGINREELVLVTGDPAEARRFAHAHHGANPRSLTEIVESLL